jgi:hypothetical protein
VLGGPPDMPSIGADEVSPGRNMNTHGRSIIRATIQRAALAVVVFLGVILIVSVTQSSKSDALGPGEMARLSANSALSQAHLPSFALAARNGVKQLVGLGGATPASQESNGLWGYHIQPNWWQSALALWSLVRYLEQTRSTDPIYQRAILLLYNRNHIRPNTHAPVDFGNEFNDDTGWWGVAWLEATRYELYVRHDLSDATKFLAVAEWDANFITLEQRVCGGLQWGMGKPPDTTTMAEFMHLTAGLYELRNSPGVFHNPGMAGHWLLDSQWALAYMTGTGLIDMKNGHLRDALFHGTCQPYGGALTYTPGEVAEALLQMGTALHQPWYFQEAAKFLRYGINPSTGLVRHGILREHCEDNRTNCTKKRSILDLPAYKGILVNALADYDRVTGTSTFRAFLINQATAVIQHAIVGGASTGCQTPSTCLFGFYWSPPPYLVSDAPGATLGGQESGIDALTSVLAAPTAGSSSKRRAGSGRS